MQTALWQQARGRLTLHPVPDLPLTRRLASDLRLILILSLGNFPRLPPTFPN